MGLLVRTVSRPRWPGTTPVTDAMRAKARGDFKLREGKDDDGLSVYAIEGRDELDLVVAAIACDRLHGRDDNVDVLIVTDEDLEGLGTVSESEGLSSIPEVAAKHRTLKWAQEQLDALVDCLLDAGRAAERYGRPMVRACVGALRDEQVIDATVRAWISESRPVWEAEAAKKKQ